VGQKKMDHEELGCNWALSMVTLCFFRIIMVGDFNSPEKKTVDLMGDHHIVTTDHQTCLKQPVGRGCNTHFQLGYN
jgi:hypothetical protein